MSCMCTRAKKGLSAFTLIELLIVVAIIAILAAIAVPNFLEAQTRAKVARTESDFRTIATAVESYTVDYDQPPIITELYTWEGDHKLPKDVPNGTNVYMYMTHPLELCLPLSTPVAYLASVAMVDPFRVLDNTNTTSSMERNYLFVNITTGVNTLSSGMWCGKKMSSLAQFYSQPGDLAWGRTETGNPPMPQNISSPVPLIFNQDKDVKFMATWYIMGAGPGRNYRSIKYGSVADWTMPWMIWMYAPTYFFPALTQDASTSFYDASNGTKSVGQIYRFSSGADIAGK